MYFFIIFMLIIATASSIISARTLVGYNNIHQIWKIITFLALWLSWMMPVIIHSLRRTLMFEGKFYSALSFVGYGLFGFAFILMILIVFREIVWFSSYGVAKLSGSTLIPNPTNIVVLTKANIITFAFAVIISIYSIHQAIKLPKVNEIVITSPKLTEELTIMQINDIHMDRSKPAKWFEDMVDLSNSYNPDIVVLPGDVVDDSAEHLSEKFDILGKLKSNSGQVYFSIGNHEFYNGYITITDELEKRGINVISGEGVWNGQVYIAGIPDMPMKRKELLYSNILKDVSNEYYKILLLHNPQHAKEYIELGFDLVLSGHTHGGQIFPFNFLAKYANTYLAGLYEINDGHLNISRGAGYWGPPMRLLAPSDMTFIRLRSGK